MPLFSAQFNSFGLDISDGSLKLIQIKKRVHGTQITAWATKNIEPGIIQNGEIKEPKKLVQQIKNIMANAHGNLTSDNVVAVLPESKTFIKLFKFKYTDKKIHHLKIRDLVEKELPNHIPVEINKLRFDVQVINRSEDQIKVLVGAVPQKTRDSYINVLSEANLKIIAMEIEAQSITRAIFPEPNIIHPIKNVKIKLPKSSPFQVKNFTSKMPTIIADLGANRSSLIMWDKDIIQFTKSLDISGNQITEQISKELKISYAKAEKAKTICGLDQKKGKGAIYEITSSFIKNFVDEINKTLSYYQKTSSTNVDRWQLILTGGSANLNGLRTHLINKLKIKVSRADPMVNITKKDKISFPQNNKTDMSTAIGLALRHLVIEDV